MSAEHAQDDSDHEEPWQADRRVYMIVACLVVVLLVVAIDATVLVPAFPVRPSRTLGSHSLSN